ncbi:TonB-dependent receptor SusC [Adhaeribacter pallidiroseus]|uniref:TonB-dependent receptor SusC n=1 Tax=Adhaeribacter pallidiroseus TaxID=2072847 RepID=A0A369QNH3_9BACT|nr:TonB-dependent receptor SusC [Adhaeribacter pallidiroseus]
MLHPILRKLKFILTLPFVLLAVTTSLAQSTTLTGKVADEKGEGLPGVTILVKGTTNGTTTDAGGSFSLNVPNGNNTIIASFVGYLTQEVPINNRTTLNITLASDTKALDEVIVVGYGTQKKSDVTGAVASVKAETLEERPSANLTQALAGRVTGANVSVNSGRPGGAANIRIRGNTSVSVTNNPLYVVDGVILNVTNLGNGTSPIDYMNPNDIASIEVLKDASATAIYGARGANGVILVTTKRGSKDGGRVNYDTYFSVGTMARKIDLLNSAEFLHVEDVAYQNAESLTRKAGPPANTSTRKPKEPTLCFLMLTAIRCTIPTGKKKLPRKLSRKTTSYRLPAAAINPALALSWATATKKG